MKKQIYFLLILLAASLLFSFTPGQQPNKTTSKDPAAFDYLADRFADIQVLRYEVTGFEKLPLKQKELAYYLYKAGLCGRDIFYDQKYKHNLRIRKTLEGILETYKGDKSSDDYHKFENYCRRFFFSNGNHHHYAADKFIPECSYDYFARLVKNSNQSTLPLEGKSTDDFLKMMQPILYDPNVDKKEVDLSAGVDHVKASCNNFYENVTEKEVEKFYADMKDANPADRSQLGFNSKLVKENGKIVEKRWMIGGMYSPAIEKIVYWLEKASAVAENARQKSAIDKLIGFYRTGDPKDFDDYCVAWVKDTASRIDAVNGFIEVYADALQKKAGFESVVSMKDMEATKRIAAIASQAQWFEDHSTIMNEHKKKEVTGITAKVITVIGEVGDAAPATPIGINLPNNEWIRQDSGSKSVSLGNIVAAYNFANSRSPLIDEFGSGKEVIERVKKYGALASDLHVDMHEVIGHASGKINDGIAPTDVTLKTYAGTLEEGRADLVALYYIMDPKLVEIGVMPSLEVGKAGYDKYIMNGLMTQLNRIKPGDNLEEAHMRNRQMNSAWVLEKGKTDKSIEKVVRNGKTYIVINDYAKVRQHFGELLREIQRIKSEGDSLAGKNLVETFGVKVDPELHKEVLQRYAKINVAPYYGFIQPKLIPEMKGDKITNVRIEYPTDFIKQHVEYGKEYGFLPISN